jgi:hypothetical protein
MPKVDYARHVVPINIGQYQYIFRVLQAAIQLTTFVTKGGACCGSSA